MVRATLRRAIDKLKTRFILNRTGVILILIGAVVTTLMITLSSGGIIFTSDESASNASVWICNIIVWIIIVSFTLKFGQKEQFK